MATTIGIFGKRNAGKSSFINSLLGQEFAIVSDKPGTTTDPVRKKMEIPALGPILIIDTAGVDDEGELGRKRIGKTHQIIDQIDIALLVFTSNTIGQHEHEFISIFKKKNIPLLLIHNKSDLEPLKEKTKIEIEKTYDAKIIDYSSTKKTNLDKLISYIVRLDSQVLFKPKTIFEGLINSGQQVVLVCPIDAGAPKGRLILPQAMAIRDLLDKNSIGISLSPEALENYLNNNPAPDLVVTDSQVFNYVSKICPLSIPLTSFSMLLARANGPFEHYIKGCEKISMLHDFSKILILESCTHHSSCDDIGRVKLPALFRKFTNKSLEFTIVSGLDIIDNIEGYDLIVQCGGCMITPRQIHSRLSIAIEKGIAVTNYGMAIAYMNNIFERTLAPLK